MRSSHTYLYGWFTLKIYSLKPTTWSMSMTQQSQIAQVNTLQPRWRDANLPTTQRFKVWILFWEIENGMAN